MQVWLSFLILVVFGWLYVKFLRNVGRLKVNIFFQEQKKTINLEVTNAGRRPIYFNRIGMKWENEVIFIPENDLQKELSVNEKFSYHFETSKLAETNLSFHLRGNKETVTKFLEHISNVIGNNDKNIFFLENFQSIWVEDENDRKYKLKNLELEKLKTDFIDFLRKSENAELQ